MTLKIKKGLATLAMAATFFAAAPAHTQTTTPTGETQVITVMPNAPGAGGSEWRGNLLLNDTSGEGTSGTVKILPAGQSTPEEDAISIPYYIPIRGALELDPLATAGYTGNATLLIVPDEEQSSPGVIARYWNERPDGQQLSQLITPTTRETMLQPGDIAYFTLPPDGFRFNLFAYGENYDDPLLVNPSTPRISVAHLGPAGSIYGSTSVDLLDHSLKQWTPACDQLFGHGAGPNDIIKVVASGGLVDLLGSPVQNNNGEDDGGSQRPVIDRLIKEAYLRASPAQAEQNDPSHLEVGITARNNCTVERISVDENGDDVVDYVINADEPSENFYFRSSGPLGIAPGTYTPRIVAHIKTETGGDIYRVIEGNTFTVQAEQDYAPEDSYNTTKNNIDTLANLMGENINVVYRGDNKHYNTTEMTEILTLYTNGVGISGDPELDHVQIMDTGNDLLFSMSTGGNAVWGGFTESQIDQLKDIYNVDN